MEGACVFVTPAYRTATGQQVTVVTGVLHVGVGQVGDVAGVAGVRHWFRLLAGHV